jgi:hypothetical protein
MGCNVRCASARRKPNGEVHLEWSLKPAAKWGREREAVKQTCVRRMGVV